MCQNHPPQGQQGHRGKRCIAEKCHVSLAMETDRQADGFEFQDPPYPAPPPPKAGFALIPMCLFMIEVPLGNGVYFSN